MIFHPVEWLYSIQRQGTVPEALKAEEVHVLFCVILYILLRLYNTVTQMEPVKVKISVFLLGCYKSTHTLE